MGTHAIRKGVRRTPCMVCCSLLALIGAGCSLALHSPTATLGTEMPSAPVGQATPPRADWATSSPVASTTSTETGPVPSPTASSTGEVGQTCSDRAEFIKDVTVRDYAEVSPGEAFVKVWALRNAGTCAWNQSYALVFFGGNRMGAPQVLALDRTIVPGEELELVLGLTAPMGPGIHEGYWRLRNTLGQYFGIGPAGGQSFWVKIMVPGTVAAAGEATPVQPPSVTPSPILEPSPTPTPTPTVLVQGGVVIQTTGMVDLDSGALDPQAGADILLQRSESGEWVLQPLLATSVGIAHPTSPATSPADCQGALLALNPIDLTREGGPSAVCYRTDEGHLGLLFVSSAESLARIDYTTWLP